MTSAEKISLLKKIFRQGSNEGVLTWGAIQNGYRWNCADHATARRLAEFLLSNDEIKDRHTYPHRFDPDTSLIIEPQDDPSPQDDPT